MVMVMIEEEDDDRLERCRGSLEMRLEVRNKR
jgi:hypothetical protein